MARPYSMSSSSSSPYSGGSGYGYGYAPSSAYLFGRDRDNTSLLDDMRALLSHSVRSFMRFWRARGRRMAITTLRSSVHRLRQNMTYRRVVSFPHMLVLVWVVIMLWGERWAFHSKPAGAQPHRVALVADPQLIDPHTYPGRPWPLNPLTMLLTDNYLRRSYGQLQEQLDPDTVFFLGDLFDGGREWKTARGNFEDPKWGPHPKHEQKFLKTWRKKYGEWFWLSEYARFGDIFVNPWVKSVAGSSKKTTRRRRKLVTSLPGNHDLGFGSEIKVAVRNRFETYFGEGNRVDVIGNHTFVSVDTVSMSAASSEEAKRYDLKNIYEPVQNFLDNMKTLKQKAVERELLHLRGELPPGRYEHKVEPLAQAKFGGSKPAVTGKTAPDLPTILLTHVPLYRPPGTPCGPLRERYPPTKPPKGQTEPVVPDHRNAISVSRGYQYQNVLGERDSEELVRKVGNVVHAFSGDDHDYCFVRHSPAQGGVPEITVKSINMAMGVIGRAFLVPIWGLTPFALDLDESSVSGAKVKNGGILPMYKAKLEDYDEYANYPTSLNKGGGNRSRSNSHKGHSHSHSHSHSHGNHHPGHSRRKSRTITTASRGAGSGGSGSKYGGLEGNSSGRVRSAPRIEISLHSDNEDEDEDGTTGGFGKWKPKKAKKRRGPRGKVEVVVTEAWTSVWRVVWMVGGFFVWLNWKG
ncbi:uncharacterized protein CTHT_0057430 [Thermochaetoides thermophila DSM 1495]|uniref:Calcineurin-like phosphoesterase domain-containing protein n=1 Tax=Chaetomium thermophilum (strain DSM 1495 / CBS 144.50 / IMI 039719) TaxID=759272 RepID=G0SCJ2_CHATD|nr:hypothetical protein CTHT_0057430 [Thermochaetoides thermophila DSM 1495]EGS19118.1 hypothetical protein CTHT_0057430 [Thermochaetoides thermophila DSM 1495]